MAAIDAAASPQSEIPTSIKIAFAALVVVLVAAPSFEVDVAFLMEALCFALFACALNLLIGCGGLLSFGHAMFFGWASVVTAHLAKVGTISLPYWAGAWNWLVIPLPPQSPEIAILGGTLVAGMLGVFVGGLAVRRQGAHFAMITLALAQMMYVLARQAKFGADGVQDVPRGRLFGIIDLSGSMAMYVFVVMVFLAAFVLIHGLGAALLHGKIPGSIAVSQNGFIGGGQMGFNWQVGSIWVLGVEADFDGVAGAKSNATAAFPAVTGVNVSFSTVYNRELDTLGTVRGRAGFLSSPSLLWFATAGLAFGESKLGSAFLCALCGPPTATQPSTASQSSKIAVGWTLGTGVEWRFAPSWSVKAEYLYVNLGSQNNTISYTYGAALSRFRTLTSTVSDSDNVARVGINYLFGGF